MDKEALTEIFKELEFRSLAVQILGEQTGVQTSLLKVVKKNRGKNPGK